jgi:hypothetical protein
MRYAISICPKLEVVLYVSTNINLAINKQKKISGEEMKYPLFFVILAITFGLTFGAFINKLL